MNRDIWIYHYELKSAGALNSASTRKTHHGALIRKESGYGCLHPWPELGDEPLDTQIESIQADQPTNLAKLSLLCAETDGAAREQNLNLFQDCDATIPESHWLYQPGGEIEQIRQQGYSTVKFKIGPETPQLKLIEWAASHALRIRADANSTFQFSDFRSWWSELSDLARQQIEFIEDPIPWNWWNWHCLEQSGVPIAVDRDVEKQPPSCPWAVYKPAVNPEEKVLPWVKERDLKLIVTSYMDHPLGQLWAAHQAQRLNKGEPSWLGDCGLLTHRCFENNAFSERLHVTGSILQQPEGTGLGFDDLLEALPWKKLT